ENGEVVDRVEQVTSISRAFVAANQWDEIRAVARSPQLRFVLSNTTEAGYTLDDADKPTDAPPNSFPAKLLVLLMDRFEARRPGLTIIPCELLEGNADILRNTLLGLCDKWDYSSSFRAWLRDDCAWLHTLVDRIVSGTPKDHPLLATDPMLIV